HTQCGQVYVSNGKPFVSLLTIDRGAVRVIMVARPDDAGTARGLVMTLSNPQGLNFVPASAPVVLQRLETETVQLGFIHPRATEYMLYATQLQSVSPHFGTFASAPAPSVMDQVQDGTLVDVVAELP